MTTRTLLGTAVCAVLACVAAAPPAAAQSAAAEYHGATALGLALRRIGPTERVLMIAAHPDDEDTQLLAALALGHGADVAYMALTRGEGGQDAIGPELFEALGLIRTEELLAARRLDGAAQFFGREFDYGFSKSAAEAFGHWPHQEVLADVVAVIRKFRPDVVVAVFTGTPRDGHGHHQVSGIVAREAFDAAGDPSRFPEQLRRGLRPWAPQKLYQGAYFSPDSAMVHVPTGYDPLLGRSYYQIAMEARSRHRSQDMGRVAPPGPHHTGAMLLRDRDVKAVPDHPEASLFGDVDTLLSQRAADLPAADRDGALLHELSAYDSLAATLRAGFDPYNPGTLVPRLSHMARLLRGADARLADRHDAPDEDLRFVLDHEQQDVAAALVEAAGVVIDAVASGELVVPGQSFEVRTRVWNGGDQPVSATGKPLLPAGWTAAELPISQATAGSGMRRFGEREAEPNPPGDTVPPHMMATRAWRITVPADAQLTEAYFLRQPRDGDMYRWPDDPAIRNQPFAPPQVRTTFSVGIDGATVPATREAMFVGASRQSGEFHRPVEVVPAVSVTVAPRVAVLPLSSDAHPLHVAVRLAAQAPAGESGTLSLELPDGWRARPASVPVRFDGPGKSSVTDFVVLPAAGATAGAYHVKAVFTSDRGERFERGYQLVDYPHIRPHNLYHPADVLVQALDVKVAGKPKVGYIMGAGDVVPDGLAQLGVQITPIDASMLASGDLSAFNVIVVGIRAYEVRQDLLDHNNRVLDYVRNGGTLIVQYQQYGYAAPGLAPYPISYSRPADRVTDETAPVTELVPASRALSFPNKLGPDDWKGWVQERGLYFPGTFDSHYTPLLQMNDPGSQPLKGALLVASYGRGTFVYTGLSLFRQLPAGVPGAYRLFANLLSLGAKGTTP